MPGWGFESDRKHLDEGDRGRRERSRWTNGENAAAIMIRRAMGDETLATCRNLDERVQRPSAGVAGATSMHGGKGVPVTALQMVSTVGATDAEHTDVAHSESACYG